MADYFLRVGKPGTATTLSSPGYTTGDTSITVGSTANWPTTTKVAFAIDRAEIIAGEEVQIAGTYTEWTGQVTGATTIASMELSSDSPNSDQNYSAGSLTRVYIPVSATRENKLVEGILQHANQDGTLITQAVRDALSLGTGSATGWEVGSLPNVSAITYNGNRSYTITHASSVATIISEGMRRRFTRTTPANTYMGGLFNGSSHYFTKTSPSGTLGTITNNFTIEAAAQPTSYAVGYICGRMDATPNNGLGMVMESDGRVRVQIFSGGIGNARSVTTYQSLPLNKKTHVAASWASGTVVIYFDGISVPVAAAVTTGSAPTTAGTGGDFSIGRPGASAGNYFPGYISNVAVFDAVLSAATIRQHATYKLTGSETNCIGAWSLDNTANDQSSAGNNLTATGGVGYTNISPFGNNGVSSTLEYALTMSVSSDGLTEVVQCPEGCALPAGSSTVTSSAYSVMASPFGFVSDKGRWTIRSLLNSSYSQATPVQNTWYNIGSFKLDVPAGGWTAEYSVFIQSYKGSTGFGTSTTLSTGSSSETDITSTCSLFSDDNATSFSGNLQLNQTSINIYIKTTTSTPYYLNARTVYTGVSGIIVSNGRCSTISITPAGL
jgi:hypothetical protein